MISLTLFGDFQLDLGMYLYTFLTILHNKSFRNMSPFHDESHIPHPAEPCVVFKEEQPPYPD